MDHSQGGGLRGTVARLDTVGPVANEALLARAEERPGAGFRVPGSAFRFQGVGVRA